jgi:CHAT domain-containing protein
VLATLWPVADESTAELMRALYQAHKDDHLDKADALRKAQLALLQGGVSADVGGHSKAGAAPFSHPFFWAPFILVGNWL